MPLLANKNILLGVSASIAAYKSVELVRHLVKQGASVKVLLTPSAKSFVSALSLGVLSEGVYSDFFTEGQWNNHVHLSAWADCMLLAPASLNTISKMVHGGCDNLLLSAYFSCSKPVVVVPAMDCDMYNHPVTSSLITTLRARYTVVDPEEGFLASGMMGIGRMASFEAITDKLCHALSIVETPLKGKQILITAGGTRESIDPVRFIGNRSTGIMGISLAFVAKRMGAEVILVLGTSEVTVPEGLTVHRVESVSEMHQAVLTYFPKSEVVISAAAVSDFKVKDISKFSWAVHTRF